MANKDYGAKLSPSQELTAGMAKRTEEMGNNAATPFGIRG